MERTKIESNIYHLASSIFEFIKINRTEVIVLGIILLVGAFLRLYKIDQYMTFLGDEGRDVIIVRRLLVEHHPPLIGPGTSIGNMYLGPIYYYMMAPALFLANFSPVGPAAQIALLGVATIFFVWWVGREWWGRIAGLTAASLYAIAPTVIIYSRSSWNPNIMPFFALLSIYSIWRVWNKHEFRWLIVLGVAYAVVLQSHYLGLLLAPTLFIFWILALRTSEFAGKFRRYTIIGISIFLILMSPLVIFDAIHGWHNFAAMKEFFLARQTTVSFRPWNAIPNIWPLWQNIITSLLAAKNATVALVVAILTGIAILTTLIRINVVKSRKAYLLLFTWLGFALLGLGLYKQQIYDHYFGFFFPAPFLLVGALVQEISSIKYRLLTALLAISFAGLVFVNIQDNPLRFPPNMQLARSQIVAKKILDEANEKPFDLAVLAERNYEDGYRYFLLTAGATVLHADIWDKSTIADQLFVVCEMPKEKCDPTHSPKAEVANFGMSKIENQWDVGGVTLYKLVHSK